MGNTKKSYRNSTNSERLDADEDLHGAARSGDLKAVQLIVSSNHLAVNSRDKHSRTPLHLAAWSGQTQVVEYLCKNKADIGAAAMDDMSAIHFAAQKGHLEVIRTLCSFGASVKSCTRKGMTPLHYAAQGSHIDLVKYLARKNVNFSSKTKAGKTPLDLASNEEIRSILIKAEKLFNDKKESEIKVEEKAEESEPKVDLEGKKDENCDREEVGKATIDEDKQDDEHIKRKGKEDDTEDSLPQPKKARVSLNHLLSTDDGEEDDENF